VLIGRRSTNYSIGMN